MATITVAASGTTTPDDWTLSAGGSKVLAVAQPDDDATSYLASGTTSSTYQWFTCSPGLGAGDTITEIVLRIRARRGGANDCNVAIGYSFTPDGGGTQAAESGNLLTVTAWGDFSFTSSGLSVVWGSGFRLSIRNTQARNAHLTTFYAEITYTAAAAGQPMVSRARAVPGTRRPHGHQGW